MLEIYHVNFDMNIREMTQNTYMNFVVIMLLLHRP